MENRIDKVLERIELTERLKDIVKNEQNHQSELNEQNNRM